MHIKICQGLQRLYYTLHPGGTMEMSITRTIIQNESAPKRIGEQFPEPIECYETDAAIAQYCDAHYGETHFGVQNFPVACVRHALTFLHGRPTRKALDIGCAVGRATFELAKLFSSVTGFDFSERFIRTALQLQTQGVIHYELIEEGEIVSYHEKDLSSLGLQAFANRVTFFQADAVNFPHHYTGYDFILAANLIDRLYDPITFLSTIHERIHPGGLLMLTSPYTWLREFTKRDNWIGGYHKDGKPFSSLYGLEKLLRSHFRMLGSPADIEFIIRETARKYQHTISQATIWERLPD